MSLLQACTDALTAMLYRDLPFIKPTLIDRLRCNRCGGVDMSIENGVTCGSCGHNYRIVGRRPISHDDPSVSEVQFTAGMSHGLPVYVRERFLDPNITSLHIGAGRRNETFLNVIDADYVLYPNTDIALDAHALPFRDESFDFVCALNVFEHLYDPMLAAREVRRVLRPGGLVLIQTAFLQPLHSAPNHYYNATKYGIKRWFSEFDIDGINVTANFSPGFTLSWTIAEILGVARQCLSPEQYQQLEAMPLKHWSDLWAGQKLWDDPLVRALAELPQPLLEPTAGGFELIATRPRNK